jgi:thioredoxin-like negative regulator of GroEL
MQTNRARDTPPPGASLPVADPPESEPLAVMSTPLPVELEAEPLSVESPATAETPPVTARCPLADALRPSGVRQVPSYWMTGASGYEDAERRRQTTAAPMVVYFFTDWCGYCKRIDRELFSSSDVDRYFSRAVFRVRVNPEENASNRSLADRFGVHSYPAFFVVPAGGGEPSRCSLYAKEDSDPISAGELERRIEERNERHARQLLREGFELRQAGDVGAAIAVLDRAVQAAPMEPEGWLQRAVARERNGDLDGALADYGVVASLRADGSMHDRAVRLLMQAKRFDEVVACATDWLQREPSSVRAIGQRARAHGARGDVLRFREDAARACALGDGGACAVADGGGSPTL